LVESAEKGLPIIIMAGGRGSRLEKQVEKPLLKVNSRNLLERIIERVSEYEQRYKVAISPNSPETKYFCKSRNIDMIKTQGDGYIEDSKEIYESLGPFISIAVDIPFLKVSDIRCIEKNFDGRSTTGVINYKEAKKVTDPEVFFYEDGEKVVPVGLNIFAETSEQKLVYLDNEKLALNVNTLADKRKVETIEERGEMG